MGWVGHEFDVKVDENDARGTHFRCSCGWRRSPGQVGDDPRATWLTDPP